MEISSFEPIIGKDAKILILGSMPGVESLKRQQYYAYSRNVFWKLIHELLGETYKEAYTDRLFTLGKHRIALWDVLKHCERIGSLDKDIKNEYPNDFEAFYANNPSIKAVFFNGQKARKSYEKNFGANRKRMTFHELPSTSPANTRYPYAEKLLRWGKIKSYLACAAI